MDQQQTDNATTDVTSVNAGTAEGHLRVRLFSAHDIEKGRLLMQQHHDSTLFHGEELSHVKLDQHFKLILSRPSNMIGIIAERNGEADGLAWASVSEYILTEKSRIVSINLIAVDLNLTPLRRAKVFIALVSAVKQWSASVGAGYLFLHVTTGYRIKETDRLVRALGGRGIGGSYIL
ncbi:hypothetical protein [Agrobacterium tumefaciens]|uniref:N-acetyltransferase domain-containing protein n=1 Tax=Agrobacterium tumefaciens TaxID=358 RepID=A0A4D7YM44_AGRTU|nr:hypothetical protein [Agrobacterium tumefaciens]QCL95488.1 hypothetical protein CFBP7129_14360 [Agrobacterium tumefaciens]